MYITRYSCIVYHLEDIIYSGKNVSKIKCMFRYKVKPFSSISHNLLQNS